MPQNWYVLIDDETPYLYTNDSDSNETYLTAVRLDTKREYRILHYQFVLEWIQEQAVVRSYDPALSNVIDILNHLTR